MIIVDTALAKRHEEKNPVRVALIGAGFMGKGIALQIIRSVPGMALAAIYNRTIEGAINAYHGAGIDDYVITGSRTVLEERILQGKHTIVEDPSMLCTADHIDAIIEVTGAVEFSARVVYEAIRHRKHVVMMNAELDATVGPILKVYADRAGVVITNVDGDQPGVQMNLYRFVKSIGVRPVLCGNIKGLHDPYRNPTTQLGFAKKWGQRPSMVTSFADGSKISFEQALVANATGMTVGRRGMFGPSVAPGTPLKDALKLFPSEVLENGNGIVDYVVGAEPAPGVFVIGMHDHPVHKHFLNLYKLGEGPFYLFYIPYHLCHFEAPLTCARAVLFRDAAIAPAGAPRVDVVATAKTDLKAGDRIDGIGGYMTYGQCETAEVTYEQQLLPMGLAEGCILNRDVARDEVLSYLDVTLPRGRFSDQLRREQDTYFGSPQSTVHGPQLASSI